MELQVLPKGVLKCTKRRIQKALPDNSKDLVEISLISTGLAPHVSKDGIFKATVNFKGKVIRCCNVP